MSIFWIIAQSNSISCIRRWRSIVKIVFFVDIVDIFGCYALQRYFLLNVDSSVTLFVLDILLSLVDAPSFTAESSRPISHFLLLLYNISILLILRGLCCRLINIEVVLLSGLSLFVDIASASFCFNLSGRTVSCVWR